MNIDIYKSTTDDDMYLSLPEGSDISTLSLPEDTDLDVSAFLLFKPSLELDPGKPRVGLNQQDIHDQIIEKGYAVHGATMDIAINLTGKL